MAAPAPPPGSPPPLVPPPAATLDPAQIWARKSFADILSGSSSVSSFSVRPLEERKGKPALILTDADISNLTKKFSRTLIGKFDYGKPAMKDLTKAFKTIGVRGDFSLGFLDKRHILIKLDNDEAYTRLFLKGSWNLQGCHMRVFKYTLDFDLQAESSIVPVWISLDNLPLYLQDKGVIFTLAQAAGTPLKLDEATARGVRPSTARICVEVDLRAELPTEVLVERPKNKVYSQKLRYEELPLYCSQCFRVGHKVGDCTIEVSRSIPPPPQPRVPLPPRNAWEPTGRVVGDPPIPVTADLSTLEEG